MKFFGSFYSGFSGKIIFLEGEMGAGEPTLARFFLSKYANVHEFQGSPSFPIVLHYRNTKNQIFEHIDLYRIDSEKELENRGIVDLFWKSQCLWEWRFFSRWMSRFPANFCRLFGTLWSKIRASFK